MELHDFKKAVEEAANLLGLLAKVIPARIDDELLTYLYTVVDNPVSLELLRNAIRPVKP